MNYDIGKLWGSQADGVEFCCLYRGLPSGMLRCHPTELSNNDAMAQVFSVGISFPKTFLSVEK